MRRIRFRARFLIFSLLFFSAAGYAAAASPDQSALLENARAALSAGDKPKTDFWIARYLGLSARKGGTAVDDALAALGPLIKKRALPPAAFLSKSYDPEFVDWFQTCTYPRWGADEARTRPAHGSVEIASAADDRYFVTVVAHPRLEAWFTESGSSSDNKPLLLAQGAASGASKPLLFVGKTVNHEPFYFPTKNLEVRGHSLHYLWQPEFYDLDKDGTPEIWLRYNLETGNGFTQVLDIYKIKSDSEVVLMRRFEGAFEGVARRLDDGSVEVGSGFASRPELPHFDYDKTHFAIWQYEKGAFKKIGERDEDHILCGKAWKKYYLQ